MADTIEAPVRVLLVEDGVISAEALRLQLESLGYCVAGTYASGEEALDNFLRLSPDVVLVDIYLSGTMDGVDLAAEMSRIREDIPLIYLTSATDDDTFRRAKQTNPFAWISKPANPENLHRTIRMALYKQRMDARLRESEERYRLIVESVNEGLLMLDAKGCITFANTRFKQMVCLDEDISEVAFSTLFCGETSMRLQAGWQQLKQDGHVVLQGQLTCVSGAPVPVNISLSTIDGEGGVICVLTDMTEQLASARALRQAEEKYRTIFENAVDGLFQATADGRLLEVNNAYARILGFDSPLDAVARVKNLGSDIYVDNADRKAFLGALDEHERVNRFQTRMYRRDGRQIWVEISARAVRDERGRLRLIEGLLSDVTERKNRELALREQATRDDLTGLLNRFYFRELLSGALGSAERNETRVGLLYIDLDRFKGVNDTYGHHAGDRVLREVAQRIRSQVREGDIVARVGGDEFCVVLDNLHGPEDVSRVAEDILSALESPLASVTDERCVGGSIGIAVYPDDASNADALIQCADEAMYRIKDNAGSGYTFYDENVFSRIA